VLLRLHYKALLKIWKFRAIKIRFESSGLNFVPRGVQFHRGSRSICTKVVQHTDVFAFESVSCIAFKIMLL